MIPEARRACRALCFATAALLLPIAAGAAGVHVRVTDASGQPVRNAVVWAIPEDGAELPPGPRTAVIEQVDREFVPFVVPVTTGTAVSFPNRDPLKHHVYSFSPAKSFEIKLYGGTAPSPVTFDRPGVVALGCNIHDWMEGYVVVLETPYYGTTGGDGRTRLDGLPAGTHEIRVWHPDQKADRAPASLNLRADEGAKLDLAVNLVSKRRRPKPAFDPLNYGTK